MSATRRLKVIALAELKSGTSSKGKPWRLFRVEATDLNGQPITERLTTFQELPTGRPIEVEVERRDDPRHEPSFTLKLARANDGAGRIDLLEQRVATLERKTTGGAG
jgi:hypothetical protein